MLWSSPDWNSYRYFGGSTQDSDFDFFVQDSPEVKEFLTKYGFKASPLKYPDSQTIGVYESNQVHIQVVENAALKKHIQEIIKESKFPIWTIDKPTRKYLWNMLYNLMALD